MPERKISSNEYELERERNAGYRRIQHNRVSERAKRAGDLRRKLLTICAAALADSHSIVDYNDDEQLIQASAAVDRGAVLARVLVEVLNNPRAYDDKLEAILKEWEE